MIIAFDPAVKPVVPLGTEMIFQLGSRDPAAPSPVFTNPSTKFKTI
jgi:hypothetical protein